MTVKLAQVALSLLDMTQIAALFVVTNGCYFGLDAVEPWDVRRDARKYDGPFPVVAHPPCERWGNFWFGSPKNISLGVKRRRLGADGGCFKHALACVLTFGGVLEHPARSRAWKKFGLLAPNAAGGWSRAHASHFPGLFTCAVEQGHYGHRARKPTWLLANRVELFNFRWGPSSPPPIARPMGGTQGSACEVLGKPERERTPVLFRNLLLRLARSVKP